MHASLYRDDHADQTGRRKCVKQLIFAAVGVVIGLVVPVAIRKLDRLKDWGYMYAGAGILALVLVSVLAEVSGGAKLGFTIAGFGIQPSELCEILFS